MNDLALPLIELYYCTSCGKCEKYCPHHVVTMIENEPTFSQPQACSFCGVCEDVCPVSAIQLVYQIMPIIDNQHSTQSNEKVSK